MLLCCLHTLCLGQREFPLFYSFYVSLQQAELRLTQTHTRIVGLTYTAVVTVVH